METVGQIVRKQQAGLISQTSLPQLFQKDNDNSYSISVYGGVLDPKTVAREVAKIKVAFPALPKDFYTLLIDRLKEKGFTDQRLRDAVNNVIDTCQYPTPTLANFLSFDKRVKLITYQELCTLIGKGEATMDAYERMRINGKVFFVRKDEKRLYNLPNEL